MARSSLKSIINLLDVEKQSQAPEVSFLNDLKRSIELSLEYDLYRQDYCGCVYSLRDELERKKNKADN